MKKLALAFFMFIPLAIHAENGIEAGKEKASTCIACHGQNGVSVNPAWPNLAGQHSKYMVKQLIDFKKNEGRKSATMEPIVANLSEQDMLDLSVYYASLAIPEGAMPKKYLSRGEQLYRGGDIEKSITACIACHGPRGRGNAQAPFPVLSGQHAPYTINQLLAYKNKERTNDLNQIMQDISSKMSREDMEAVAYYVQGLH